ncbi:MAG: hypothetical protein ACI8S6_002544 [Myxococcota bacterium]|jgi:hypothetical protein
MAASGDDLCGQVMIRGDGLAVTGACASSMMRVMRGRIKRRE